MDNIIEGIQEEFRTDLSLRHFEIRASRTSEKAVKLEGVMISFYHKQIAQTLAKKVIDSFGNGVVVNNQIEVVYKRKD